MNKITKGQFISLMLIGDVFVMFCLTGSISLMTAAGFTAGCGVQLLLSLPLAAVYRSGNTLSDCGKSASAAVLGYLVLWGGSLFSMLHSMGDVIFIPYDSGHLGHLLIAAVIALVCIYISSSGIKALARSAVIAAAVGAVCLLIVIVSAVIQSDPKNLRAQAENSFVSEIIRGFAVSGGTGGFIVLLGYERGSGAKAAVGYFTAKMAVMAAMLITGTLVCGGIMDITSHPIAQAAQLSQPFPVQRIDSLFLIVFSVFAVYAIAVQAVSADLILGELIPKMTKYRCAAALGAMAVTGAFFGGGASYSPVFAVAGAALMLLVPAAYGIRKLYGLKRRARA